MMTQQAAKFARHNTAIKHSKCIQRDTVHHVLSMFNMLVHAILGAVGDLQAIEQLSTWLHSACQWETAAR